MTNDELKQRISNSDTFCFYPFLEMSTNPAGHIKPCCYYGNVLLDNKNNNKKIISIMTDSSFEEAWNSDSMVQLRKKITTGESVSECNTCYRDGKSSMRIRSIQEYIERDDILDLVNTAVENDYRVTVGPKRLELKPSNLCNLKCVMCNRYDSTQIEKELVELANIHGGITVNVGRFVEINLKQKGITEIHPVFKDTESSDWSEDSRVWDSFVKMASGLESLSFAGGEPTLIPFVYKALKHLVDTDNAKNIRVFMSSNFTNLNKNFIEIMPKFKKFEIIASIDGIGSVNEYARFPSKWTQVYANYIKARDSLKGTRVKLLVNITVNLLNIMDLADVLWWIDENYDDNSYWDEWPYNINLIWAPNDQHIENLPLEYKKIAISRLEKYIRDSEVVKKFPNISNGIDLVITQLNLPSTDLQSELLNHFRNKIQVLDTHRGIWIGDYIPALKELFPK